MMEGIRAMQPLPVAPLNTYDDAVYLWSIGVGYQEAHEYFTSSHPDIKYIYGLWDRTFMRDTRDKARRQCNSKVHCFCRN